MSLTAYLTSLAALTLALVAGCGGNVIVDKSSLNEGGGGSSGGTGGAGAGTTTGTTTTITNTNDYCASVCNSANQYDCLGGDVSACVSSCLNTFAAYPSCASEATDLYDCAVQNLPQYGCSSTEQACQTQLNDFSNCAGEVPTTCGTTSCSGDTYSCQCGGECNGYKLEVDCKGDPATGTSECQCIVDAQYIGSCQDNNLTCDIFGCCAQYFPL